MEGHVIPGDEHDPTPYVPITPEQARAAVTAIAHLAGDLQRAALSIATSARRADPDSGWADIADAGTQFAAIAESAGQLDALERHQTTS